MDMDPISFVIGILPEPWGIRLAMVVLAASIADVIAPAAEPPSRWALPRAALHIVALNRQAAQQQIARWRGVPTP